VAEPTELELWFGTFWETYPADLAHQIKGSRKKAMECIVKMDPDKELQETILGNLRELVRYCRRQRKADGKTDRWPHAVTWLNQERWEMLRDIGSHSNLNEKIAASKCVTCGADATHTDKCWKCYDKGIQNTYEKELKRESANNGLQQKPNETPADWSARCRKWWKETRRNGRPIVKRG
jgi:hypothetical protein